MNKVISIDEGEEPEEFLKAIGAPPSAGSIVAKSIKAEDLNAPAAPPSFSTTNSPSPAAAPAPAPSPAPAPAASPAPAPVATPSPVASPAPVATAAAPASVDVDRVLGMLRNLKVPEGYQREMIIIGNSAYSYSTKEQVFLGKKKVERILEPIGSLPEGVFFADGYAPRVIVENGIVLAIEFLKKEKPEVPKPPAQPATGQRQSLKQTISSSKDLVSSLGFKIKKD